MEFATFPTLLEARLAAQAREQRIRDALTTAVRDVGIDPRYLDDVLLRAHLFTVSDDGQTVALDDGRGRPLRNASGEPIGPTEWLQRMLREKPRRKPAPAGAV